MKSKRDRHGRRHRHPARGIRRRELSCLITAVLATGGMAGELAAREVPFAEPPAITTSADGAIDVYAADVDRDGDGDILSASAFDNKIAWHENTAGDGSAWTTHIITTASDGARSVATADVNGDGDLDIIMTSTGAEDHIIWFEQNGLGGGGWQLHTISIAYGGPAGVSPADIDEDGDIDVFSALDSAVAWHESDGIGVFWTAHTIVSKSSNFTSVRAADVDEDGDIDAFSSSVSGDKAAWYENTSGDGSTWSVHLISTIPNTALEVFPADIDGDGDIDAISADYQCCYNSSGAVHWHENTAGDGSSWSTHTLTTHTTLAITSAIGDDIDGDGDIDVIFSSEGLTNIVGWYENDGSGKSWTLHTLSTALAEPLSVYTADLDRDGDADALAAAHEDDTIAWYRNETIHRSAKFPDETILSAASDSAIAVFGGDLDGDGDMDGLSASAYDNTVAWHENDGRGNSWTFHTITTTAEDAASVYAADVDGDGDLDALSASYSDTTLAWYESHGGSWITHTISTTAGFALSVFAADVDADTDLDVLATSASDDRVAWYENDGSGAGWTLHTISLLTDGPASVFAANVDGDADVDVFSASLFDDTIAWHENDGTGGSWTTHSITGNADSPFSVHAADIDGDGDADALSASFYDDKIAWYENDNDGAQWSAHTISTSADGAYSVVAADMDYDGDLDVLAASFEADLVAWYENDGSGGGWARHTVTSTADGARSVFAIDGDGDGDLDVISASRLDDTIAFYRNRGGQFGVPTLNVAQKVVGGGETHDLLDIELIHRGRQADSDIEFQTLELELTDENGIPYTSSEADDIIKEMRIYRDDGSGVFEASSDTVVATVFSFNLVNGIETVTFSDGNADLQVPPGAPAVYFVTVDMTTDAETQDPSAFKLTHLTESSSTAEDAAHDTPLVMEFVPEIGTGVVDTALTSMSCEAPFDLQLADRTVTTTVDCQAGTFIRAGTDFTVGSGGDLSLRAGETVRFTSGFHVGTGTLTVNIDPGLKP